MFERWLFYHSAMYRSYVRRRTLKRLIAVTEQARVSAQQATAAMERLLAEWHRW